MRAIFQKEIKETFSSPFPFILAAVFSLICGLSFLSTLQQYINLDSGEQRDPIFYIVIGFFTNVNFILVLLIPLLTMNIFSKEYKQGTMSLLLTSKLSHWAIIWGKFVSVFAPVLLCLSSLFVFVLIFWFSGIYETSYIIAGVIGILANSILYVSIGIFTSQLFRESSVVAAFGHIIILILLNTLHNFSAFTDNYIYYEIIRFSSIVPHFVNLLRGIINSSDVIYYLSLGFLFLFFTKKTFEFRAL